MTRGAISDLPPERPLMATRGTGTRFLCYGQNQVERELHMISAPKHHGTGHMPVGREYALLTLDVFDTCLIRDFIGQESLWYLLGAEIMKQLPGVPSEADFVRLRGDSENYARSQSTAEDIKLAQVYERLGALCGWDTARQQQAIRLEEEMPRRALIAGRAGPEFGGPRSQEGDWFPFPRGHAPTRGRTRPDSARRQ
jgi:hypothetical protein